MRILYEVKIAITFYSFYLEIYPIHTLFFIKYSEY